MLCLARFFQKESYQEQFLQGKLYASNLERFREMEDQDARADICEGTSWSTNPVEFSTDPEFHKKNVISELWGPTTFAPDWTNRVNLICTCVIDIDTDGRDIVIPGEICKFGDYGIVIVNPDEFLRRVKYAVRKMGNYDLKDGPVKYSDIPSKDMISARIVFQKRECYKGECEYRLAIFTGPDIHIHDPLILDIGNITDIATPLVPKTPE